MITQSRILASRNKLHGPRGIKKKNPGGRAPARARRSGSAAAFARAGSAIQRRSPDIARAGRGKRAARPARAPKTPEEIERSTMKSRKDSTLPDLLPSALTPRIFRKRSKKTIFPKFKSPWRKPGSGSAKWRKPKPLLRTSKRNLIIISISALLILAGVGVAAYFAFFTGKNNVPVAAQEHPIIATDKSINLDMTLLGRTSAVNLIEAEQNQELGIVGDVVRIVPSAATTTSQNQSASAEMNTAAFLSLIAPHAPVDLVQSLSPQFLLGMDVTPKSQPFLIFKTNNYQGAFVGMLDRQEAGSHVGSIQTLTGKCKLQAVNRNRLFWYIKMCNSRTLQRFPFSTPELPYGGIYWTAFPGMLLISWANSSIVFDDGTDATIENGIYLHHYGIFDMDKTTKRVSSCIGVLTPTRPSLFTGTSKTRVIVSTHLLMVNSTVDFMLAPRIRCSLPVKLLIIRIKRKRSTRDLKSNIFQAE